MRIADKMNYEQVKSNLAKNRTELADLQNQSATMKRVTKPSDDPLAATRVLQTKTEVAGGQQFLKSVTQAKTFLEYSDQSLAELTEVINRAKELALAQANDASTNHISRQATASEIDQLFSQSVQIGNRKLADRFLFGGFKTTRPPFDAQGKYYGDEGEIKISVQKEGSVAMNMPGSRIFLGRDIKAPATAGPDPSQMFKDDVAPHAESDAPDASGHHQMRGPASLPATGNALSTTDSEAKETSSREVATGLSAQWASAGVNVFNVLRDLSTGLRTNDKQGVQESLDRLDEGLAQVVLARAQLGSRVTTLNAASESLQKGQVDSKTMQSNLEDADAFELVSDINKTESTLKSSLSTSGKLIQPSLLDFLR
jgi:flagellar hook-associated protein 3 FlgL